jgi:hypothetical protein
MADLENRGRLRLDNQLDPDIRFDPKSKLKRSNARVELAFHHVIPHISIFDCYNALASHIELSKKARLALEAYLRLFVARGEETKLVEALLAGPLPIQVRDKLHFDLTYANWNIVEGPARRLRTDDPKDGLDLYVFGVKPHVRAAQEECRKLYGAIEAFNRASSGPKAVHDDEFVQVQTQANLSKPALLRVKESIRFDPTMWEVLDERGGPRRLGNEASWRKKLRD